MRINLAITLCILRGLFLGGCATTDSQKMLNLSGSPLEERRLQTRVYETSDDRKIFDACIATLQDLEYTIEESDINFGVITGNKHVDATEAGQVIGAFFLALLTDVDTSAMMDATQYIRATIVTIPKPAFKRTYVRLTIQRVVFNAKGGVSKAETIKDEAIYQNFFEVLSKAVFLEGHRE